mgnify:CR=1
MEIERDLIIYAPSYILTLHQKFFRLLKTSQVITVTILCWQDSAAAGIVNA